MTPTEQDKLREQVHKLFGDYQADDGGYQSCYDGKWIDMTNEVCAVSDFITADRKRVELEARINERNKIALDTYRGKTVSESTNWQAKFEHFMDSNERRIAELKAQEEEL